MKNRIYKYFFREFIHHFLIVIFALTAIIWTIQAVNFLDLVTDDGHAFKIYLLYSFLTIPKVLTKLIPFTFLIASILTILKFEKNNELILLWTSGLNKIHITNLIFCTSSHRRSCISASRISRARPTMGMVLRSDMVSLLLFTSVRLWYE